MKSVQLNAALLFLVFIQIDGQKVMRSSCGRRLSDHNKLITKGFHTTYWPWHAAIYHVGVDNQLFTDYKCGGTLINSVYIITASHCVSQYNKAIDPAKVSVSLGRLNLGVSESSAQSFEVAEIIPHPHYNAIDENNDIAIIRLSTEVTFNNYVQPICMWDRNKLELSEVIGKYGIVIGWGFTEHDKTSQVLQQAFMPVIPSFKCLASNRNFFGSYLSETNFCAGFRNGTSVCNGDSGGSMAFEENGLYYIRGIVSVGLNKINKDTGQFVCDSDEYAIFTDVAQYLPWIDDVTNKCERKVQCKIEEDPDVVCALYDYIELSEQKCKIIFTEDISVTWLNVATAYEVFPDVSDAIHKFKNLKVFQLSHTKLKKVERTKLATFKGMERLYLYENEIIELTADNFDDFKNLTTLSLVQNQIEILPDGIFQYNDRMEKIWLSNNKIKEVHRDLFMELRELTQLSLNFNELEILPEGFLRNNQKLERIHLGFNNIKVIHEDLFMELSELSELFINYNYLEILPEGFLRNNQKLERLYLANNTIKVIHEDLFMELRNLKILDLSENQIEILPTGLLRNNEKLQDISFGRNKIKKIGNVFLNLPNFKSIQLAGNDCFDEVCEIGSFCGTTSLIEMNNKFMTKCPI